MTKAAPFFYRYSFAVCLTLLLLFLTSSVPLKGGLDEDVLTYTNRFRESNGLPALVMRNDLNTIARKHSEDMAKGRSSFGHDGYRKRELQIQKLIKPFYGMAENVASGVTSGKEVVDLWKSSTGHRRNMLGDYKYIGIGTARNKKGIIYYTQIFVH